MTIDDRKKALLHRVGDRLEIRSQLRFEDDVRRAKTHADLDGIECEIESAEMAAEEEDLFYS